MRIVTLISSLGPGGTERAAENYTLGYRAAGAEVIVLCNRGGHRAASLQQAGVPVFIASDGSDWERAVRSVEEWRPDIVHVHRHCATPETTALLERLRGVSRRIIETNVFARFDSSPVGSLLDISLQLSRWCLWKWTRWSSGRPHRPIGVVLPYAIDCFRFEPLGTVERCKARQQANIPEDAFVFGRIGQPLSTKWSPAMLTAFRQLALKKSNVYLFVIGMPASLAAALDSLPPTIRNRVVSLPFMEGDDNLRRCYGAMDCFLHVAEQGESFGYVLCEAMSCGVPVITLSRPARDNSQVEVVGHMRGGLVANTPKGLSNAMELLSSNPDLHSRLSESAPAWVRSRYDLSVIMPRLLRICEISLSCENPCEMLRLLRREGFETEAEWADLRRILEDGIGKPSKYDLMMTRAVHMPAIYSLYSAMKAAVR